MSKQRRAGRRGPAHETTPLANTGQSGPRWLGLAACGLIAAAVLFIYLPAAHFGFVNWDDGTYITDNPWVLRGLSWGNVVWALTTGHPPYWHPVTWLSHMADVTVFGVNAGAFHLVNVAIHFFNAVLLFLWWRAATRATAQSLLLAALFAVLPVQVEAVTWIAERKEVLSAALLLVSLHGYLWYTRVPTVGRYLVVCTAYALALMAKPSVVTFPVLLLLLDVWPLARASTPSGWRRLVLEKVPLAALAVTTAVVTVWVQTQVGALPGLAQLSWTARLANAVMAYPRYLSIILWPVGLAAYYPLEPMSLLAAALAALLLIGATAGCIVQIRSRPFLFVGWMWFVIGLVPVLGLIQSGGQAVADRFVYLPVVGVLVITAWGGAQLARRAAWPPLAIVIVVAILFNVASAVARAQVMTWADSRTLWTRVVAVTPPSGRAYENLGQARRDSGDLAGAVDAYARAIDTPVGLGDPSSVAVLRDALGDVLARQGRLDDAVTEFERAVRLDPTLQYSRTNLGNALAQLGRLPDAEAQFREAIRLKPTDAVSHVGLANVYLETGRTDQATGEYHEAVRLDPSSAPAHKGLATTLVTRGDFAQAAVEYREAIGIDPSNARTYLSLGLALMKAGDSAGARAPLEQALLIDPLLSDARSALALAQAHAR
jgi:Flp pilus assembly protein TadD